jgi:hypothetical protein
MDGSSYRLAGIECAAERLFCVAPLASLGGGVEPGGVYRVGVGWWAGRMVGPVAFVGREAELSRLVGLWAVSATWVMGTLAVMAKKRRRTFGTVVRLPSGRIAGY